MQEDFVVVTVRLHKDYIAEIDALVAAQNAKKSGNRGTRQSVISSLVDRGLRDKKRDR
jgi:hypothetical protein